MKTFNKATWQGKSRCLSRGMLICSPGISTKKMRDTPRENLLIHDTKWASFSSPLNSPSLSSLLYTSYRTLSTGKRPLNSRNKSEICDKSYGVINMHRTWYLLMPYCVRSNGTELHRQTIADMEQFIRYRRGGLMDKTLGDQGFESRVEVNAR